MSDSSKYMSRLTECCPEKYVKKLMGKTELEDALRRLDKLTHEEAWMATAQVLKATHTVDERVRGVAAAVIGVDDRVARIEDGVTNVNDRVAGVVERVAAVDDRMAHIDERAKAVDDKVAEVVDGKQAILGQSPRKYLTLIYPDSKEERMVMQQTASDVNQVKRLSFPASPVLSVESYASFQGTNCERAFIDGSPHQTRPQTITSRVIPIIREQQHGSFKEAYSRNGWQRVRFSGSTENVCPIPISRTTLPDNIFYS